MYVWSNPLSSISFIGHVELPYLSTHSTVALKSCNFNNVSKQLFQMFPSLLSAYQASGFLTLMSLSYRVINIVVKDPAGCHRNSGRSRTTRLRQMGVSLLELRSC